MYIVSPINITPAGGRDFDDGVGLDRIDGILSAYGSGLLTRDEAFKVLYDAGIDPDDANSLLGVVQ